MTKAKRKADVMTNYLRGASESEQFEIDVLMRTYSCKPTGSRYYSGRWFPGPDTDFDLFCYGSYQSDIRVEPFLHRSGYSLGGSGSDDPGRVWSSYKRGRINVIVCRRHRFYTDFNRASEVCWSLGDAIGKPERIVIFRMMLYNEFPKERS